MKMFTTFLAATCLSVSSSFAELDQIVDGKTWLGYFVGWDTSSVDYGVKTNGQGTIVFKEKKNERIQSKGGGHIIIDMIVEEKDGDRWVRKDLKKKADYSSETEKSENPKKPVKVLVTLEDGTKVAYTHFMKGKKLAVKPEIIEKAGDNPLRIGMNFRVMPMDKNDLEIKKIKKSMGKTALEGKRPDGKKVKVMHDEKVDLSSADYFPNGATMVSVECKKYPVETVFQASDEVGKITLKNKSYIYKGVSITWMVEEAELTGSNVYADIRFK